MNTEKQTPLKPGDIIFTNTKISDINSIKANAEAKRVARVYLYSTIIGLTIFLALMFFGHDANAECKNIYIKPGIGYKLETGRFSRLYRDDPYFLRLDAGVECENLMFGLDLGKQVYSGTSEYFKDNDGYKAAFYIDYKFEWPI
jgi:hypothetical protein